MHKYSAVLAAAEPFRKQCIVELKRTLGIKYFILTLMGMNIMDPNSSARNNIKVDTICSKYEIKLDEIVRSYGIFIIIIVNCCHNYHHILGIPLGDFNYLSDQITRNTKLKQRILLQVIIIILLFLSLSLS